MVMYRCGYIVIYSTIIIIIGIFRYIIILVYEVPTSIFPTINIFRLFRSKKRTRKGNQKCLKN